MWRLRRGRARRRTVSVVLPRGCHLQPFGVGPPGQCDSHQRHRRAAAAGRTHAATLRAMSMKPLKLAIAALGGQGGAVLTGWLIEIAEANAYFVQSTSVPGVAQRTGATLYYLEFFPRKSLLADAREPVMALMPVAGDVDCVVAAELVEAGRSMVRGLVTPE